MNIHKHSSGLDICFRSKKKHLKEKYLLAILRQIVEYAGQTETYKYYWELLSINL